LNSKGNKGVGLRGGRQRTGNWGGTRIETKTKVKKRGTNKEGVKEKKTDEQGFTGQKKLSKWGTKRRKGYQKGLRGDWVGFPFRGAGHT